MCENAECLFVCEKKKKNMHRVLEKMCVCDSSGACAIFVRSMCLRACRKMCEVRMRTMKSEPVVCDFCAIHVLACVSTEAPGTHLYYIVTPQAPN